MVLRGWCCKAEMNKLFRPVQIRIPKYRPIAIGIEMLNPSMSNAPLRYAFRICLIQLRVVQSI